MTSLPSAKSIKQPFFKLTAERAKADYKEKLITAEAYILYLLDCHRSVGWKWSVEPSDFCNLWQISRSTFYRAISSLKSKGKINWEVEGKVTMWRGSDIGIAENPIGETENPIGETENPIGETENPIGETENPIGETENPIGETGVSCVDKNGTQTVTQQGVENLIYIQQIDTELTDSVSISNIGQEETTAAATEVALPVLKEKAIQMVAITPDAVKENPVLKVRDIPEQPPMPSVIDVNLQKHLDMARQGIEPSAEIAALLMANTGYQPTYSRFASMYGWHCQSGEPPTPGFLDAVRQMKEKRKVKR